MIHRRTFMKAAAAAGSLGVVGNFDFLTGLSRVSAAEAKVPPSSVKFNPEIEPLVRLIEQTLREKVLQAVAERLRAGVSYAQCVAALMLAGVRNIQPRPVGFKFHAVLVVNSAHLASISSPDTDRWLPVFWAIDQFKSSQAADEREGNWTMSAVDEALLPPAHRARQAFIEAMDNWDESAADVAVVQLARTASAHDLFELFCRYGMRDFRDIGHKAIYVANSFRTLEVIGWHHAEPILRSLAYALLDRAGASVNPAKADLPADRPFRVNTEAARRIRAGWMDGKVDAAATREFVTAARTASADALSGLAVEMLNRGVGVESIVDGLFAGTGELLMRSPGIVSLHAVTSTNALHYAFRHCRDEETRRLLLLQNASFLPLFRGNNDDKGVRIDELEAEAGAKESPEIVDEIFADISRDRLAASRKIVGYLRAHPDPAPLVQTARRLIFLKGNNSHDYKFSSAVLEDYSTLSAGWRERFLAASAFQLRGSGAADNELVGRIRQALQG